MPRFLCQDYAFLIAKHDKDENIMKSQKKAFKLNKRKNKT